MKNPQLGMTACGRKSLAGCRFSCLKSYVRKIPYLAGLFVRRDFSPAARQVLTRGGGIIIIKRNVRIFQNAAPRAGRS